MKLCRQTGAILIRVAASHLRVGTFQYDLRWGNVEELRSLADYTLERQCFYFVIQKPGKDSKINVKE